MQFAGRRLLWVAAMASTLFSGCYAPLGRNVSYLGHADLQHYKDVAASVEFPSQHEVQNDSLISDEPRRLRHPRKEDIWDMPLMEAVQIGLRNNKLIRERDQFLSPRNPLTSNPEQASTVFDPAVQETNVLFGQRGVEAALSDFDAQFTSSMNWGRNEQVSNNLFLSGGLPPGTTLVEDTAAFRARIDKQFADSSQFSVINNWDYSLNNVPGRLFPSAYTGVVRAEFRRPLLAGAGTEFTRIFGPISRNNLTLPQGVVISRINEDITVADFEAHVHQLVRDIELSYWDLSLAYRNYHAQVVSFKSAMETWRLINAKTTEGLAGGAAKDETQARETLFAAKSRAEDALANIYVTEGTLRRMLGLSVNDGRIIRPSDEPAVAEFLPDWHIAVAEGITNRPEIRRQKWNIKSLDLQVRASRSLTKPRVDFVSGYSVNGFGNNLFGQNDDDGTTAQGFNSAFESITQGNQTGWNLGIEASIPFGYRSAHLLVRNLELRATRARAALAEQELEIAHEVRNAFQTLDRTYTVAQTAFNRRIASEERVRANEAEYELRGTNADELLRSQTSLADAEVSYFQTLIQYNQAITDFYYRTGTILAQNNIVIGEDSWAPEAQCDALRRAWARSHAFDNPHLHTEPEEFVQPAAPTFKDPPIPGGLTVPYGSTPAFAAAPYGVMPPMPASVPPMPTPPAPPAASPAPAPVPSPPPAVSPQRLPQAAVVQPITIAAKPASDGWHKPIERQTADSTVIQTGALQSGGELPAVSDWSAPATSERAIEAFAPPSRINRPANAPHMPPVTPLSTFDDASTSIDAFDMPLNQVK